MIHAVMRTKKVNPNAKMWLLISPWVVGELAMRPIAPIDKERPKTRSASVSILGRGRRSPRNGCVDIGSTPSVRPDAVQEISDDFDVMGAFFPHRQVGALLEPHELGAADSAMNALGHPRRHLVVAAHGHEGGDLDAGELVRHIPIFDRADDRELVRSVHREVDRLARVLERVREFARPHAEAAQIPPVEHDDRREVRGVLVVLARLVLRNGGPNLRRQPVHEPPHLADRQRDARQASRDDEASQVPLVLQRGRDREGAAVARAHQVDLSEPQRLSHRFDLLDVMGDGVEVGDPRTFGFPATELVHEHDSIPELGEVLQGQKVVVRHPRSAVKAENGPFRGRSIGAIEELEAENLDVPFGRFHAIPGSPEYEVRRWSFWNEPRPRPDAGEPTLPDDSDEPRSRDAGTVLHFGADCCGKNRTPCRPVLETYYVPTSPDTCDTEIFGRPWNPTRIRTGEKPHARHIRTRGPGTPGTEAEPHGSRALPSLGVRRAIARRNAPHRGRAGVKEGANDRSEPARGRHPGVHRGSALDRRWPPLQDVDLRGVTTAVSAYASYHPLFGFAASVPPIPRRGPSGLAILRRLARAAATWMFPIRAPRGMTSLDPAQGAGAAAPTRGAFQVPEPSEV